MSCERRRECETGGDRGVLRLDATISDKGDWRLGGTRSNEGNRRLGRTSESIQLTELLESNSMSRVEE